MDPRERADAALARARARGAFVVTPDDAVSPMDAVNTVQIPRAVVNAADHGNPDNTMVIPTVGHVPTPQQPGYPQQQPGHQTGPHQPVPYPGNQEYPGGQYQSGHLQPVPPSPAQGHPRQEQAPLQRNPLFEEQPQQQRNPLFEDEQPTPRQLDGLVPTTHHPGTQRGTLSRRLDGH